MNDMEYLLNEFRLKQNATILDGIRSFQKIGIEGTTVNLLPRLKEILNTSSFTAKYEYEVKVLSSTFDFVINEIKSKKEIEMDEAVKRYQIAKNWYNSLTQEEKRMVDILTQSMIAKG